MGIQAMKSQMPSATATRRTSVTQETPPRSNRRGGRIEESVVIEVSLLPLLDDVEAPVQAGPPGAARPRAPPALIPGHGHPPALDLLEGKLPSPPLPTVRRAVAVVP